MDTKLCNIFHILITSGVYVCEHSGHSFKFKVGLGLKMNNSIELMVLKLIFPLFMKRKIVIKLKVFEDSINMIKWINEQNCINYSPHYWRKFERFSMVSPPFLVILFINKEHYVNSFRKTETHMIHI